jgi:hypothetical protein
MAPVGEAQGGSQMSRSDALQPLLPPLASIQRLLARFNRHGMNGVDVDISLGILPFEVEAVERSEVHQAESISIRRLPSTGPTWESD